MKRDEGEQKGNVMPNPCMPKDMCAKPAPTMKTKSRSGWGQGGMSPQSSPSFTVPIAVWWTRIQQLSNHRRASRPGFFHGKRRRYVGRVSALSQRKFQGEASNTAIWKMHVGWMSLSAA